MDTNLIKSKAFSIRSIMSSPLAKVIFDAINAPHGSTKRAKAKAIMKSFELGHANYLASKIQDGQGGGGTVGLDITGNLPLSGNSSLAQYAPKYTGQSLMLSPTGDVSPSLNSLPAPIVTDKQTTSSTLPLLNTSGILNKTTDSSISPNLEISPTGYAVPITPSWLKSTVKVEQPVASAAPTSDQSISGWDQETADMIYNRYINAGYTDTQAREELKKRTSFVPTAPTINPAKLGENTNSYDTLDNFTDNNGISELDTWYNAQSPADQTRLKSVYEAVKNGIGSEAFSMQIMGNKNLLSTILNVPKEVVDNFPESGLLSDQLNSLQDTINTQYKLDSQLTNLTNLQNQGLTIKSDLQAYIRGKDEYLGKLDKMINDFDMKTAYMDTSDPNVAQRMNNYRNYLTILQGKQNQRYIDYLNTAIDDQNAKLTQATNLYNLSLGQAEKQYNRASAVTTETYNDVKSVLKDLYKNIDDRTQITRDTETYQLNQLQAYYQLQKLIAENKKLTTGTYDAIKTQLEASRGNDVTPSNPNGEAGKGYVNIDVYKKLRSEADDKTGFDKNFSFMLNPNDPSAQEFIKQENTPAWMVDAAIWQWLALDATKNISDEEKAQYIKEAGRDPETFGLYGYY